MVQTRSSTPGYRRRILEKEKEDALRDEINDCREESKSLNKEKKLLVEKSNHFRQKSEILSSRVHSLQMILRSFRKQRYQKRKFEKKGMRWFWRARHKTVNVLEKRRRAHMSSPEMCDLLNTINCIRCHYPVAKTREIKQGTLGGYPIFCFV